jgi:hypothetical protein
MLSRLSKWRSSCLAAPIRNIEHLSHQWRELTGTGVSAWRRTAHFGRHAILFARTIALLNPLSGNANADSYWLWQAASSPVLGSWWVDGRGQRRGFLECGSLSRATSCVAVEPQALEVFAARLPLLRNAAACRPSLLLWKNHLYVADFYPAMSTAASARVSLELLSPYSKQ